MKIVLTGANGYVGQGLMKYLPLDGNNIIPIGFGTATELNKIYNLDLTDVSATASYFKNIQPDMVIHLAGNKDVFKCETDKAFSRKINYKLSKNLVDVCSEKTVRLIYISTDYVFAGTHGPYSELSPSQPTTQYGKDKLAVENFIRETLSDFAIVRTAGIFGLKNDFIDVVCAKLKQKETFHAFTNLKNSPTFIKDLGCMLQIIIKKNHQGTFHCAGSESLSRYAFALKIAEHFHFEKSLIVPEELALSNDPRPTDLSMSCTQSYATLSYYPKRISEILEHLTFFYSR